MVRISPSAAAGSRSSMRRNSLGRHRKAMATSARPRRSAASAYPASAEGGEERLLEVSGAEVAPAG